MKTYKLLFAAALATLGLSSIASAQTAIYISGAPATRAIWNQAILNTLTAKSTGSPTITKYWSGGTVSTGYTTANQIVLTGGNLSGTAVTIYASWTGSTGGNQSVANTPPATISALKVGFLSLSGSGSATAGGGNTFNATLNPQYPQVNLSDTLQSTLPFNGTTSVTTPATSYVALTEATTHNPAVTGFEFVTNKGAPSRLSNITTNLAQTLFTTTDGTPLALFSGSSADQNIFIYPVGRDIASGARYILLAETGIGTANSNSLVQYAPALNSGSTGITGIDAYPSTSGTINLITPIAGNGGYSSFTPVLAVLSATSSDTVGYPVTYVTDSDATTVIGAGGHALNWNGVPYSVAAIQQGQYTYWSYLHVYYNNTGNYIQTNFPLAKSFADFLAADLATDVGTGAILTSSLSVTRSLDGGLVTGTYY